MDRVTCMHLGHVQIREGKRSDSHRQVGLGSGLTITSLKYHVEEEGAEVFYGNGREYILTESTLWIRARHPANPPPPDHTPWLTPC